MKIHRLVLAFTVMVPCDIEGQSVRDLPAAEATYEMSFSDICGLHALTDSSVLVCDFLAKQVVRLLNPSTDARSAAPEGRGPLELSSPSRLLSFGRDSAIVFDSQNMRYLLLGARGEPLRVISAVISASASGGGRPYSGLFIARATDARGRLYAESSRIRNEGSGRVVFGDTVAILRFDSQTGRVDSMGFVRFARDGTRGSATGAMPIPANPLSGRDEWTVFPDGRVAIVRHDDYRVDFVQGNGSRSSGPALPLQRIRVTYADRRWELDRLAELRRNSVLQSTSGSQSTRTMQGGDVTQVGEWPAFKPPFRAGAGSVRSTPDGSVWVQRLGEFGATGTLVDVLDQSGRISYRVRIPDGLVVEGFASGLVFTSSVDADGLKRLHRHRMP